MSSSRAAPVCLVEEEDLDHHIPAIPVPDEPTSGVQPRRLRLSDRPSPHRSPLFHQVRDQVVQGLHVAVIKRGLIPGVLRLNTWNVLLARAEHANDVATLISITESLLAVLQHYFNRPAYTHATQQRRQNLYDAETILQAILFRLKPQSPPPPTHLLPTP